MAELTRQCNATVKNSIGKLAEVTDSLKNAGVIILTMCAWGEGDVGRLILIADDPVGAYRIIIFPGVGWAGRISRRS